MSVTVLDLSVLQSASYTQVLSSNKIDLTRSISHAKLIRPALFLAGHRSELKRKEADEEPIVLLFEKDEVDYLMTLDSSLQRERLNFIMGFEPAFIVVADGANFTLIEEIAESSRTALYSTHLLAQKVWLELTRAIERLSAPTLEIHATLVDIFGLGVLLTGKSGVGKSETALGLIERRHRLVCDDIVKLRLEEKTLIGMSSSMTEHHIEVRGIGLINVAYLFGVVSVIDEKKIDLVVELEIWDKNHDYDRLGLDWSSCEWLGVELPHYCLPVKPGRDLVLLVETIALQYRLRTMGHHAAESMRLKLQAAIDGRSGKVVC